MREIDLEKTLEKQLKSDLASGVPDVWTGIEAGVRRSGEGTAACRQKRPLYRRKWFRGTVAAVLAAAVCAAGAPALCDWIPAVRAHAQTVYDSGGRLTTDVQPSGAIDASFVDSYNGFGLALLKRLSQGSKNVFISPASIYLALGMTCNGAKGQTAADFARALGSSGISLEQFNRDCLRLQGLMAGDRFRLANSIWIGSAYQDKINGDFLARDKNFFGASVGTLDFTSSGAPGIVNRWVKKNTENRIDFKFQSFNPNTAMLLLNTIYFKSDWKNKPFNVNKTADGTFHSPVGNKTVKFMRASCSRYFENGSLQGILLPYDDGKTSMMILLPKKDLGDMLGGMNAGDLAALVKNNLGGKTEANLMLPRVNFRYGADLSDSLKAMGMKLPFDAKQADFSGMAKADTPLFISGVEHRTYLAVDEKGTEAAAATAVLMSESAAPLKTAMKVDRPFLTAIVNNETGAVLFAGTVTDPSASD